MASTASGDLVRLMVGTYSRSGSVGLYPLTFDPEQDRWTLGKPDTRIADASFGTYSDATGCHYFVEEKDGGAVGAYRRSMEGWECVAKLPTGGAQPCHLSLDNRAGSLAVANYGSGSLSLFGLDPASGHPAEEPTVWTNLGRGPNPERQKGPHAHWVGFSPDQRHLYVVDLGTDEVLRFPFDPLASSIGEPSVAYSAPPGSGPRFMLFHRSLPIAYLVSELASTLTMLHLEGSGDLRASAIVSTIPNDAPEGNLAGYIAASKAGDRLYVTNRGHDSIAVFALSEAGEISPIGHVPSGGASPRMLLLLEPSGRMVVANEEGNSLTVFALGNGGMPQRLPVELHVPGPAFLAVLDKVETAVEQGSR